MYSRILACRSVSSCVKSWYLVAERGRLGRPPEWLDPSTDQTFAQTYVRRSLTSNGRSPNLGAEQMYAYAFDSDRLRRRRPIPTWKLYGRRVAMGLAVFVFTVFAMAQVARGSAVDGYTTVTVEPGDTLWSIASARYPSADPREKVREILDANGLSSPAIHAGEQLKVPAA